MLSIYGGNWRESGEIVEWIFYIVNIIIKKVFLDIGEITIFIILCVEGRE